MAAEAEAEEPPSDDLRCRRSDGRGWRCKRPALDGFPNCETHLSKAQRRRFLSGDPVESPCRGRPKRPPDAPPLDLVSITNVLPITKKKRLPRVPITEGNLSSRVLPTSPVIGPPQDRILTIDRVVSSSDPPTRMTVKEEAEDCPLEVEVTNAAEGLKESVRDSGCSRDVPDDHRCHRTDGKRWRCRRQAMEDHYYCELHRIQAYRRQYKLGVPEALKLKRGRVPATKKEKVDVIRRNRKGEEVGDGLDEVRVKRQMRMERPVAALVRRVMRRRKKAKKDDKPDPMRNLRTVKNMESVPEHLRCRRTDGKRWRCSRRALDNLSFCEIHHIQAYRRQYKLGVPESLKLKRRPRGSSVHPGMSKMPITRPQLSNWVLRKNGEDMNEDELRRAAKMEKRRKENEALLVDVMRMVLQRQMEKRRDQKRREEEAGVTRGIVKKVLPNGLMSISPPIPGSADLMGEHFDRKIVQDSSSFLRWCFRSKNVDTPPAGSLQVLPYARKAVGSGKRRRRICHHCRTSPAGRILRCSRCRKASFCRSCIKKWYSEFSESDIRLSCPVCRGKCCCEVCTSTKPKD